MADGFGFIEVPLKVTTELAAVLRRPEGMTHFGTVKMRLVGDPEVLEVWFSDLDDMRHTTDKPMMDERRYEGVDGWTVRQYQCGNCGAYVYPEKALYFAIFDAHYHATTNRPDLPCGPLRASAAGGPDPTLTDGTEEA
jgi:hypothetical protein